MSKGNVNKRTITELTDNMYKSKCNKKINDLFLRNITLDTKFCYKDAKYIFEELIDVLFNEIFKYGRVNIHNFGSFRLSTVRNNKVIKINFNKTIKTKVSKLNELYMNNKVIVPLCNNTTNTIVYLKEVDLVENYLKDLNLFLELCKKRKKPISSSGEIWKYILIEFYELCFLKIFELLTIELFTKYMINIQGLGMFCFKYNKKFGLYIKYEISKELS